MQFALALLLLACNGAANAWWNCSWPYRFLVDISSPPGGTLTNYEVRIDLNAGNVPAQFDWNALGDDLRVVANDDLTPLNFFIERWDAAGQAATLWVRVPSISGGGTSVYIYFGAASTASASTILTFTQTGTKFHTRNSNADPTNRTTGESAFVGASPNTPGYGCRIVTNFTGLTNAGSFAPPSRNDNFGLFGEAWFQVTAGQAGLWQFRYGADFGRGGGLYVDDVPLEEDWNDDLWWANNFANTGETLEGSIVLAAGWHSFRVLGFEDCCDGAQTAQFMPPGGAWQAFSTANLPIVTRKCPNQGEPQATTNGVEVSPCPSLTVTRNTATESDPLNVLASPKAIPGAVVVNEVRIVNSGSGTADTGSFTITDAVPANMALRVLDYDGVTAGPVFFADGAPASGLSYSFGALNDPLDDVEFSSDGGTSFGYSPTADANGVDLNVTHIRITPGGPFSGDSGSGSPSASFYFKTVVQ